MGLTARLVTVAATAAFVVACSAEDSDGSASTSAAATRPCGGEDTCSADQFCVASQGALCMPLPPPGGQCQAGCLLTEHCCNCTVHACLTAPADVCPDGPTCACLDNPVRQLLLGCDGDRRTCDDSGEGAEVTCIVVGLDENPF